jgi:hypothetical protein
MANTDDIKYVLIITVFVATVIASHLRVNQIVLIYQQERQPPDSRQFEPLMQKHKLIFLILASIYVLLSITTAEYLL